MGSAKVTAEFAQTEVASLLDQAAFHKRQARKHRAALNQCMAEAERLRRMHEALGIEHVEVPVQSAHSQEAESNARHTRT